MDPSLGSTEKLGVALGGSSGSTIDGLRSTALEATRCLGMGEWRQKHSVVAAEEAAPAMLAPKPSSLGGLKVPLPDVRRRRQQNQKMAPAANSPTLAGAD